MDRSELYQELVALADSFDNHVTADDVIFALEELIVRLDNEGLAGEDD